MCRLHSSCGSQHLWRCLEQWPLHWVAWYLKAVLVAGEAVVVLDQDPVVEEEVGVVVDLL